jgi:DNA-binding transcriptional regulator YdaS (Cro superfamily)
MARTHQFPFPGTMGQLAQRCGVTREHLTSVLHRRIGCSPELAMEVERETESAIRKSDLRPDLWPKEMK